jgi:hypothetical protein
MRFAEMRKCRFRIASPEMKRTQERVQGRSVATAAECFGGDLAGFVHSSGTGSSERAANAYDRLFIESRCGGHGCAELVNVPGS